MFSNKRVLTKFSHTIYNHNNNNNKNHEISIVFKRFATVVVSGSTKNQGKAKCPGKRRGPKKTSSQKVFWDDVLIAQKEWVEPERQWHGGFNVNRGRKGFLNASQPGRVLYYYDTNKKKKYVHVVPEGEDPSNYMRPFYTADEIYSESWNRSEKLLKEDKSLNVRTRDRELNEYRLKQSDYILNSDCLPLELLMQFEKDTINNEDGITLSQFSENANKLSNLNPLFGKEQINASIKNHLLKDWQLKQRNLLQNEIEKTSSKTSNTQIKKENNNNNNKKDNNKKDTKNQNMKTKDTKNVNINTKPIATATVTENMNENNISSDRMKTKQKKGDEQNDADSDSKKQVEEPEFTQV